LTDNKYLCFSKITETVIVESSYYLDDFVETTLLTEVGKVMIQNVVASASMRHPRVSRPLLSPKEAQDGHPHLQDGEDGLHRSQDSEDSEEGHPQGSARAEGQGHNRPWQARDHDPEHRRVSRLRRSISTSIRLISTAS